MLVNFITDNILDYNLILSNIKKGTLHRYILDTLRVDAEGYRVYLRE